MLTHGQAKKILARYSGIAGSCPTSDSLELFTRKVYQQLLWSGPHGSIRKFCFNAVQGCFTAPYELEAPLKIKIENHVGTVLNKWYEFYVVHEMEGCEPVGNALFEEPNTYSTVYDLPNKFCRIGVLGTAQELPDAHIIISGKDPTGREIFTEHAGQKISGEYLSIEKGKIHYTQVTFGEITSIEKSLTNGYVTLFWMRPELGLKGFMSDYAPSEEHPEYRRFRLTTRCNPHVRVSILARIRLKEKYADNDKIPFENISALELAGSAQNASFNNDESLADAKDKRMIQAITRETEFKRSNPGSPFEVFIPTSGGGIKGIV